MNNRQFSILLLVLAVVGSIGGALLVGHILDDLVRILLGLKEITILTSLLPLFVLLIILGIVGTTVLVLAFRVENTKMKIAIVLSSTALPIVVEVIDLSIRGYFIIYDYANLMYPIVESF